MKPYYDEGGITIYHGSCLEILPTLKCDAIVSDPPYGIGLKYASHDDDREKWFVLMNAFIPIARASAPFVIIPCCGIDRMGWWYANHEPLWIIAWYKGSPGHRSYIGFNDWEAHLVWGKAPKAMHDYFQSNCGFEVSGHPCPKPIEWALWLITRAALPGQLVIDPFMGSGTTLVAAKQLGRRAIGIEMEEKYCEIAVKRLAQDVLSFGDQIDTYPVSVGFGAPESIQTITTQAPHQQSSALAFALRQVAPIATQQPESLFTDPVADLASALKARGHRLLTRDGKLFLSNANQLTDADRATIKAHKPALLALAEAWPEETSTLASAAPTPSRGAESSQSGSALAFALQPAAVPHVEVRATLAEFLGAPATVDYVPDTPPDLTGIDTLEFDTETSGLRWWEGDRPIGLSCRRPDGSTFYLPWGHAGGNHDEAAMKRWCERELRDKHLVGAGIKFDVNMMKSWGIDLEEQGCTFGDVQIYAALLDGDRKKFNLDILSKDFLGKEKTGRDLDKTRMTTYHASEVAEYAKTDVALTGELRAVMMPLLDAEDLQYIRKLEDAVIPVVCHMERNGAPIDLELLDRWVKESEATYNATLWALAKEVGRSINPDAASDLEKLFEHLHLPITRLPSGAPSFTDAILKRIDHPLIKQARYATKLSDLRSRYLLKYQKAVGSDGILRYAMHQTRYQKDTGEEGGVGPGRFSSSELTDGVGCNIQQVMKLSKQRKAFGYAANDTAHDDEIHLIRKLMVPRDGQWLSADLMQVEFRLFSHYAGNKTLLQAYHDDPLMSFHDKAVEMVRPHYPDVIYDEQKNWTFAYLYGAKTIKQAVMMEFITDEEGKAIRDAKDWNNPKLARTAKIAAAFNGAIPEAEVLMKKCARLAEERGWIKTVKGRRSRFAKGGAFHKSMNNLLQGGSADYMKEKLVEIHNERKNTGFLLRFSVHDELDGDAREPETLAKVQAILDRQSWPELKVPLLWDIGIGHNWAEAK